MSKRVNKYNMNIQIKYYGGVLVRETEHASAVDNLFANEKTEAMALRFFLLWKRKTLCFQLSPSISPLSFR